MMDDENPFGGSTTQPVNLPASMNHVNDVPSLPANRSSNISQTGARPELVNKIEAQTGEINGIVQMPGKDAILSVSSDRSVRVWLLRDSGQYWPSICHYMGGSATALHYNHQHRKVFVGLDNGMISVGYLFNFLLYTYNLLKIKMIIVKQYKIF